MKKQLEKLIDIWLQVGINIQGGQPLYITLPDEYNYLKEIFDVKAQQLGVTNITYQFTQSYDSLLKNYHGHFTTYDNDLRERYAIKEDLLKNNCAYLEIRRGIDYFQENQADALQSLKQIENRHNLSFRNKKRQQGNIVSCKTVIPTQYWADYLFPKEKNALTKLWDLYFDITLANLDDAISLWNQRIDNIQKQVIYLNQQQFKSLSFTTEKSHLNVELVDNHAWVGGCEITDKNIRYMPNFPTQEIFTAPKKTGVTGVMCNTKPLCHTGRVADDFTLRFEHGKLIQYNAMKNQELLEEIVHADENNSYCGEIAILPGITEISKTNTVFHTTILDENAACHLALGCAYPCSIHQKIKFTKEEFEKAHLNYSTSHVDVIFGDPSVTIIAHTKNGEVIPLMQDGKWSI